MPTVRFDAWHPANIASNRATVCDIYRDQCRVPIRVTVSTCFWGLHASPTSLEDAFARIRQSCGSPGKVDLNSAPGARRTSMAAIADVQTVNITINDIEIAVPKGELIVESVKRVGLEIPIFCYHPRMKPVGMCRMCLVEVGTKQPDGSVRKMPKPQAGCTLPASEGLVIYTDTEQVQVARKGVLEFLLINHPLDCPICDRGGECPLQNNTLFYGPSTSRYIEVKRHAPKAYPLSKYVTLDLERCIQCGRCVRFTQEISGDAELAFRFRGASMQPSTFELKDFESKFSGNVIEICPVGALTNAKYRFRARPWDLQTREGICTGCSNGCNVWLDFRGKKLVRQNGRINEAVNEEWTCDKGKFGNAWYEGDNRLDTPFVRKGNTLTAVSWADAYGAVLSATKGLTGNAIAALGGSTSSNEDLYLLQSLFRNDFESNNLDHRWTSALPTAVDRLSTRLGLKQGTSSIASFEGQKAILVFGTNLADEEPILFLRVRKAWFNNGTKIVVAHSAASEADAFADVVLRYKEGTGDTLAAGLALAAGVSGADARFTPEYVEGVTGVSASLISEAASIVKEGSASVITTKGLFNAPAAQVTLELLASLAVGVGGRIDNFALSANDEGATQLGILPDVLPGGAAVAINPGLGTKGILEGCASGEVKVLWLLGSDPFALYPDKELVKKALENVEFLIVQDALQTEAFHYASVVLPLTGPAETEGSYTNLEGRVQWFGQVVPALGEAKPAWRVIEELRLRMKPATPLFNPKDVLRTIAAKVPGWSGINPDALEGEGALLS